MPIATARTPANAAAGLSARSSPHRWACRQCSRAGRPQPNGRGHTGTAGAIVTRLTRFPPSVPAGEGPQMGPRANARSARTGELRERRAVSTFGSCSPGSPHLYSLQQRGGFTGGNARIVGIPSTFFCLDQSPSCTTAADLCGPADRQHGVFTWRMGSHSCVAAQRPRCSVRYVCPSQPFDCNST